MKRMRWWAETRWLVAQYLLRYAMRLTEKEMGAEALQAFLGLIEAFRPAPEFNTVPMQATTGAALFKMLADAEALTLNPERARYAVIQEDGSVRLVEAMLFQREGDIAHVRGTPGFEQALRYWRVQTAGAFA